MASNVPPPPMPPLPPSAPVPPAPVQYAPPPGVAPKKTSPLVWVLAGCGVIVLLALIAFAMLTFVVGRKIKGFADEAQRNPAVAAAELVARTNPDLEVVDKDYDKGTITIRNRKTGEEVTLDANDVKNGRFRFRNEKGEEMKIDAKGDSSSGRITFSGKDGDATFGTGTDVDLPSWVPTYPDAAKEGVFNARSKGTVSASVMQTTDDDAERVLDYFESSLKDGGFEVTTTRTSQQGSSGGMVMGNSEGDKRFVSVVVGSEKGRTTIHVSYKEGEN